MTWTKLSDSFGDELAGLSDAAFRTHVEGLLWTMRRETDGHLGEREVRRFAETAEPGAAVQELLDHGLWAHKPGGYVVLHHLEHQPEREVMAARRATAADRQARKRRKDAGLGVEVSPRESRRDDTRDPGRDGSGRAGTGQAHEAERENAAAESWSDVTVAVPGAAPLCELCQQQLDEAAQLNGLTTCTTCELRQAERGADDAHNVVTLAAHRREATS